jgi:hypothetical protein
MPINLDHQQLARITAQIGYRLRLELDDSQSPMPTRFKQLVRALDELPTTRSPSIVPHGDGPR